MTGQTRTSRRSHDDPIKSFARFHGAPLFYPASPVKLFFMVEEYRQGKLLPRRARLARNDSLDTMPPFLVDTLTTPQRLELEGKRSKVHERRRIDRSLAPRLDITRGQPGASARSGATNNDGRKPDQPGRANANSTPRSFSGSFAVTPSRHRLPRDDVVLERPLSPAPTGDQVKDFLGESLPAAQALVQGRRHQRRPPRRRLLRAADGAALVAFAPRRRR